jgi:hypothetical protein
VEEGRDEYVGREEKPTSQHPCNEPDRDVRSMSSDTLARAYVQGFTKTHAPEPS